MLITRRPAQESDRSFVHRATRLAYEDVVVRQFGPWDVTYQDERFEQKWRDIDFEIVEDRGEPVGVICTTEEGDHLWLREVFLLPVHQGRGIGSALVEEELARARRLRKPLRLRVLRMNRARALYERLGFTESGETETHFWMEAD